jgi:alpha-L-fucosidase
MEMQRDNMNMANRKLWLTVLAAILAFTVSLHAQVNPDGTIDTGDAHDGQKLAASESAAAAAKRLQWWSEARFGMFIHWGLYAHDGCYWKGQDGKTEHMMRHLQIPIAEYEKIATEFNPVKFSADEWVRVAKDAGMKYMVITTKHHDGFAMFDSPSNDYNIVKRTPFKRDAIKELAEACRKHGLKFGVYYSLGRDWHDPDVPTSVKADGNRRSNTWDFPDEDKKDFTKYFERKVKPQVRELLTQYGPIAVMWFDTPERISKAQSEELLAQIRKLQPGCIVNARIGNRLGDYAVSEQKIPDSGDTQPWETCMTLNKHWGYKKGDEDWKPTEMLVHNLVDIVSKGGNFLLNVGPTGEGIIPVPSVTHLAEVGAWMKVNGEAIYGTTASPLKTQPKWGRVTKKVSKEGTTLYLHVFDWPKDGPLVLPDVGHVQSATLLANGRELPVNAGGGALNIVVPSTAPDKISSTIVVKIKGVSQTAAK